MLAVTTLKRSAERMARMVDQLLDFIRIRRCAGLPIEPAPADLHEICAQVVTELATAHPERRIRFEAEGDCTGYWDRDRLAQVVSNLVSNALLHGAVDAPIELTVQGTESEITVVTHNGGAPIPAEILPVIFDAFRRGKQERGTPSAGVGLGALHRRADRAGPRRDHRRSHFGGRGDHVHGPVASSAFGGRGDSIDRGAGSCGSRSDDYDKVRGIDAGADAS